MIAEPVRHSISPAVHNRAFQSRRMDAVYLPFLVSPAHLRDFFSMAEKLPLAGFSVTIPHKQKIIRYLDAVDSLARRIGAVNTVWRKAGKWRGANTDAAGRHRPAFQTPALAEVERAHRGERRRCARRCVRASRCGRKNRAGGPQRRSRARTGQDLRRRAAGARATQGRKFDAVVHATPLGMYPNINECYFNGHIPGDVVFDLVYNPVETALLQRAREQGRTVIPGIEMFVEQAVRQFEIWTGETAPRPAMQKAAAEALECKS